MATPFAIFDVTQYGLAFRIGVYLIYLAINLFAGSIGIYFASKLIKNFDVKNVLSFYREKVRVYGYSLWTLLKPLGLLSAIDLIILLSAIYIPIIAQYAFILGILNLILVGGFYFIWVIKKDYNETWWESIIAWFIIVATILIVQLIIALIVSLIIANFL